MNRKTAIILLLALVSAVSCRQSETSGVDILPFVGQVLADTTSVEYMAVAGYDSGRLGTIAVIGPLESTSALSGYLMECDLFDNVDGKAVPDGLDDFAGETFAAYYDVASPDYYSYFKDGTEDNLREMTVRHAIAAVSDNCHQNAYSRQALVPKARSKMLVLSSSFASVAASDISMLFSRAGKDIAVISPVKALAVQGFARYDEASRIGIWACSDILASGVYASAFYDLAIENGVQAIDYVGYSPSESLAVREGFFEYLDMYMASGDDKPLSVILLDDIVMSGHQKELEGLVDYVKTSADPAVVKYRHLLSGNCTVIGVMDAVASSCYRHLRRSNSFTHRIAYPQEIEYMIVPSPESKGEVKYIEMNNLYVP
ncbi:MAG: hypothetical protein K2O58_09070 [Bacteroidales bacterium]|nr:hypothetical protein [Bacteroidales bacterium]MDE7128023.1 hypothetical protein [Bacteroidales bacterium]